jgi:UDP-N-acetylglucosamine acyltransferase
MPHISPNAIIDKSARLAPDVQVGAFTWIGPGVEIGPGTIIENNVTITGRTVIGERNHIFAMAVIGIAPNGADGEASCTIGPANAIREHATIYGGIDSPTEVGTDNLIMVGSIIGPAAHIANHCVLANLTLLEDGAQLEDYVGTSSFTTIGANCRVGAYSFVAGYSAVDRDAPPFGMLTGAPYRVRGVNSEKLKRCGFGDDDIRAIKAAFRELFNGSGTLDAAAVTRLADDAGANPQVRRVARSLLGRPGGTT